MQKNYFRLPGNYRQLSNRFIHRVSHASRQEQWGRTFVELAWTAGPVTYLALQAGYLLGFGHRPPENLFFYFGGYTLVTGIVSVATRFVYNLTRGRDLQKAEAALHSSMSSLPDLVAACRNSMISFYEPEYRPAITSQYILNNPDAGPEAVEHAVELLTGSKNLSKSARTVEIYRRQGLGSLCKETAESVVKELRSACIRVAEVSPELSRILYDRMNGKVISKRDGQPRIEGFLFRGQRALEYSDPSILTLGDTVEIATLVFELLAGRQFPRLHLKYHGARIISERGEQLERSRRAVRAAVNRRNARLWDLGEHLRSRRSMKRFAAAVHAIHSPQIWLNEIEESLKELKSSIRKKIGPRDTAFIRKTMNKLRELERADRHLRKAEEDMNRAKLRYSEARKQLEKKLGEGRGPVILREGQRLKRRDRAGISLVSSEISLDRKQQRELAKRVAPVLEVLDEGNYAADELVQTGYSLMQILEETIPIYRWSIASALERSNAPDLSQLEQGLTSATKIGWGLSLVRELRSKKAEIIHALARSLVNYHRIELNEDTIQYFADNFNADDQYLRSLEPSDEEDSVSSRCLDWTGVHAATATLSQSGFPQLN